MIQKHRPSVHQNGRIVGIADVEIEGCVGDLRFWGADAAIDDYLAPVAAGAGAGEVDRGIAGSWGQKYTPICNGEVDSGAELHGRARLNKQG